MTSHLRSAINAPHIPALDAVRAFAVTLVVGAHAGIGPGGDIGVNAFFVLSGFLITHLLLKEYENAQNINLRAFYFRRALRIFPAYYVFLVFSYVVDQLQGDMRSREVIWSALTYTINYQHAFTRHSEASIAHTWSLAVEEQFYLLWPLALLLLVRKGYRTVVTTLLCVIGLAALWRTWGFEAGLLSRAYVYNAFDARCDSLAVGCLVAAGLRTSGGFLLASKVGHNPIGPVVCVALVAVPYFVLPIDFKYGLGFTYQAIVVVVLLLQLMQLSSSRAWSWLSWRWIGLIGTLSYSMYLYHQWGLGIGDNFTSLPHWGQVVVGYFVTLLLAASSYFAIEKPFLRLKKFAPGTRTGAASLRTLAVAATEPGRD
jgi:peptidoglycan/LPS O-acetylase OafA/YrhL